MAINAIPPATPAIMITGSISDDPFAVVFVVVDVVTGSTIVI
jgi:hypothetical protein